MASSSIVFKTDDPTYADDAAHARQAALLVRRHLPRQVLRLRHRRRRRTTSRGRGYQDELVWGAIWLYKATGDATYLAKAETEYDKLSIENQTTTRSYKWTVAWDDKSYGDVRAAGQADRQAAVHRRRQPVARLLDGRRQRPAGAVLAGRPGRPRLVGFAALRRQHRRSSRSSTPTGSPTPRARRATTTSRVRQINYALGDNPRKSSYVVGFGANPPQNPHHRTAHGSWLDRMTAPDRRRGTSCTARSSAARAAANDTYTDSRGPTTPTNEVATDYNAGLHQRAGPADAGVRRHRRWPASPSPSSPTATRSSSRPCSTSPPAARSPRSRP